MYRDPAAATKSCSRIRPSKRSTTPLPNHLHVEWSIRALEAGKHVLCEKPIACSAAEVAPLIEARDRTGLLVEEAVMVRDHPQWSRLRDLIDGGDPLNCKCFSA